MATKIVHFGSDECSRVILLSGMGYSVDTCGMSLPKLREALTEECDAIAIEGWEPPNDEAVIIARQISSAPVILFEGLATNYNPSEFDLVVRSHTPPREWLHWLEKLIAETHVIRRASQLLRERSATTRQEARTLREQSQATREQSAEVVKRIRNKSE